MKSKSTKKSRLTLDDLKKKGNVHNENLASISGGVLGMGTGGEGNDSRTIVDGDKRPK